MKKTMYELLGMIKDGKAPEKIMFLGNTYRYDEIDKTYRNIIGNTNIGEMHNLEFYLDDEVEILEDKKIKNITTFYDDILEEYIAETTINGNKIKEHYGSPFEQMIIDKINEIMDYLECLESKGE